MSRSSRIPYVLSLLFAVAAVMFLAQSCGGSPPPQGGDDPHPLCYLSQPVSDAGMRPIRTREWAQLVVRGYHEGQQSTQNCAGDAIEWHPTNTECDLHEDEHEHPPQPVEVNEESVVVGRSDDIMVKPVWVITHHFDNGDGFGPVVITQRRELGVAVQAIGTLRLPIERARLRLRNTGGQQLLIADGERCPHPNDQGDQSGDDAQPANAQPAGGAQSGGGGGGAQAQPAAGGQGGGGGGGGGGAQAQPAAGGQGGGGGGAQGGGAQGGGAQGGGAQGGGQAPPSPDQTQGPACLRESVIMPVVGNEVMSPEIRNADGTHCIGRALVYLSRQQIIGLANGWERVFRLAASMEYDSQAIIVHEQVIAEDRDPRDLGRPPVLFRTTDHDRYLFVSHGQMRSRGIPLFERALRANGSLQLPVAETRGSGEQSGSGQGQGGGH